MSASLTQNILAFDLGGESGRAILGAFDGQTIQLKEVHRFPNKPVRVGPHFHWNVLSLWDEICTGIRKAAQEALITSIGIDTWGVDFGLLDTNGDLIANPHHYRDNRADGMLTEAYKLMPRKAIYEHTGAQFMQINTLYQLLAMQRTRPAVLAQARTLLLMPDLFHYWLTGVKACEFSNATTTQFFNPRTNAWAREVLTALNIPHHFLPEVVPPGSALGPLSSHMLRNLGVMGLESVKVIAPATHDTGSAVAAVPAQGNSYAYISSGTWSLMGIESKQPIISDQSLAFNITNEGGVGSFRILKNIMGLWLVQECRRKWAASPTDLPYSELMQLAQQAIPLHSFINPDADDFLHPNDMPLAMANFCRATHQPVPVDRGAVLRCALESLALKYRYTLDQLELLTGQRIEVIHILGGGSQNTLLCQLAANACQRPVLAGPVEATALGNVMVQLLAQGAFASLDEARAAERNSFPLVTYEPKDAAAWEEAYGRFRALVQVQVALE
jgi:rhamnulokinase